MLLTYKTDDSFVYSLAAIIEIKVKQRFYEYSGELPREYSEYEKHQDENIQPFLYTDMSSPENRYLL